MFKLISYVSIIFLLTATQSFAGSGLYFGLDSISHDLRTRVEVDQTFSSPPPDAINVVSTATKNFSDAAMRIGYKYKRRLNHQFFMSPEFMLSQFDDDLIYGSNFKIGVELKQFSMYGVGGISRIEQFDKNQVNYGIGLEYRFNSIFSVNVEWQKFATINENTSAIQEFGEQVLTTVTDTRRDITAIKFGITVYLHE